MHHFLKSEARRLILEFRKIWHIQTTRCLLHCIDTSTTSTKNKDYVLESREAGEGRKVQNTPDSFLLTEHSAISNGFIAFFSSLHLCDVKAQLLSSPGVYLDLLCRLSLIVSIRPLTVCTPLRFSLSRHSASSFSISQGWALFFLSWLSRSSVNQSARSYSLLTW